MPTIQSGNSFLHLAIMAFFMAVGSVQPGFAESLSGSAADAFMDTPVSQPKPVAKPRKSVARATKAVNRNASVQRERATSQTPAAERSAAATPRKSLSKSASNAGSKADKAAPVNTEWSAKGAINLDAIRDVDGLPGLFLVGGPSLDIGGANALASGAQQAGIGSAIVVGIIGAFIWIVAALVLNASRRGGGARPGSYSGDGGGGLAAVGAVAAFVVMGGGKLFLFPDHAVDLKKSDSLDLTPVYSNEFGLHCVLPKDLIKARMHEGFNGKDIAVTVAGYRRGKNEMMVGYAHMPSMEEMIKAKQAQEMPKLLVGMPNMGNLNFPGAQKYYYFDVNKALDGCVDAAGKRANFKVSYRVPIQVQGKLPGREYEGTASHGRLVRGRVFIGYNNYYHAIVVGEQSFVNSNDGYKFLDSMDVH